MRRKLFIACICLLAIVSIIVWPIFRVRKLNRQFGSITSGDDRSSVVRKVGKPWKDGECGAYVGGRPPGCGEEFIYAHPYAPVFPEYWVVYFDAGHHVINSVHLVSP